MGAAIPPITGASAPPSATSGGTVRIMNHLPDSLRTIKSNNSTHFPGYHLPRVRERDTYYTRLEQERAAQRA
ncbi:hypothetical protein PENSUB_8303 [Penicillium subrubescens]|uniref:Uncharacterized protein n=1 Tax=Penicillium subrubescens TaxID=1316194 RepID=A0A1Q5THD7_9EURO|nr:hypothetical protein PENSUB_8303 [Penicillium subrubescens]